MSSLASPRGPLPPRVYWVRRAVALVLLAVFLLLVVGGWRLIFGGNDEAPAKGQQVAAEQQPGGTKQGDIGAVVVPTPTPTPTPQAQPNGRCTPADIQLTPSVNDAVAGQDVPITLTANTRKAAACVWRFAAKNVVVKVTRDKTAIWSSTVCADWIPAQTVVLRAESTTPLAVNWSGRRSDTGCQVQYSDYATAGTYQVAAGALGGETEAVEFGLRKPTAADVASASSQPAESTQSPSASSSATGPAKQRDKKAKPGAEASTPVRQQVDPSAAPSGAVEPD